ncbi:hypothetical protein GE573_02713 [Bacillus velezensis]|nr:hypothetical protein GE573_02713 [Bacillus velezensis]
MVSIDRFQILKEHELKILEHWFKNDNIKRRMDAMLPLDAWYARLNKDEDDTVIMAYGRGVSGRHGLYGVCGGAGVYRIDRQSFVPASRVRKTNLAKTAD